MDIWQACKDRISLQPLEHDLLRMVECQEQIATNSLVDNLLEQDLLEQMLEQTKPQVAAPQGQYHYLLSTPFRYPPLRHGSRFGTRQEPSLFYGSHKLPTALAETAYYRFVFWRGMVQAPPSGKFTTQHTLFKVRYKTHRGLQLQQAPFDEFKQQLTDPAHYTHTQSLGTAIREQGAEAFEYISARDPQQGVNAALFSQVALADRKPRSQQSWLCETNDDVVHFFSSRDGSVYSFVREIFLVGSDFPEPAI